MKFCTKCVIPETAETHEFDEKNMCSVCEQVEKKKILNWDKRGKQLDELISKYQNKYDYDCIVPFSGGKDSTFALWYLVKKKKLKPLVLRFDHNFLREKVLLNTEKTLNQLGVDFVNFKPNFSIVKKIMIESLLRRGDFCWHCHVGISAFPINSAIKRKIPLIFYGEPSAEYSSFYKYEDLEELNVEKFNKAINLGINAEDMLEMIKERFPNDDISIKDMEPYIFPTQREINQNKIKAVYLGNYIPWDVKKQVQIIKAELGWEGDEVEGIPPEYDYEKIECMMQGVRDYIRYLKRGFGRTAHLTSIDIRNNRMTRDKAKELTSIYDGKKPKALELFLKITKMTEKEFNEIIKKHVVSPHTFPDEKKLSSNSSNIKPKDLDSWIKKF
ncbi:N-acetyl sugar amidotransferase [Candidatus Pelagibacter sp.]|nr:N-acetyl sugar amidotransferase [Candidatus Pelagibacter sp.]